MASALIEYLDSVKERDPAARSRWEILLYPGVWALALHRVAHWLYGGKLYFLARFVNHLARMITAIDIHPGAKIGERFFISLGFEPLPATFWERSQFTKPRELSELIVEALAD